ncbi:hypothetical protein RZS08_22715, partial [Arthrospira platensis SPKY1]|nr:hypothetical protein [Arthrospira platensis SPKY1]
ENFPVDGIDNLHETMRITDLELQVRRSEIDIHADGYLRVPAQKATIQFQPRTGGSAGFSLISDDFEIRIHQNGSLFLEWEGAFNQFSFDGLLDMGWLPESVELPALSFAELALSATTHQNGQAPHYTLGARLPEPYEVI